MIEKVIDFFLEKQIENKIIEVDEVSVYKYGYTLVLEAIINFVLALVIGIVLDELLSVMLFLLFFVPLRSYCGGRHASTIPRCVVITNLIIFLVAFTCRNKFLGENYMLLMILDFLFILIIFVVKPQDSKSKKMDMKEKTECQKIVRIQLLLHFLFLLMMTILKNYYSVPILFMVHMVQIVLLLIRDKNDERKPEIGL